MWEQTVKTLRQFGFFFFMNKSKQTVSDLCSKWKHLGVNQHSAMCLWNSKSRKGNGEHPVQLRQTFFHTLAGGRSCKRQQEAGGLLHIPSPQPNTPPIGQRSTNTLRSERGFSPFAALQFQIRHWEQQQQQRTVTQEFGVNLPLVGCHFLECDLQCSSGTRLGANQIQLLEKNYFYLKLENDQSSEAASSPVLLD